MPRHSSPAHRPCRREKRPCLGAFAPHRHRCPPGHIPPQIPCLWGFFPKKGFSCAGFAQTGFTCTGKSSLGKSLCGKIKNPRKAGILGRYLAGRYTGADRLRTPPNRGVSRGDGGGVRGCCGVVLSYNFLPESKTYIPVRWAFHLRKSCDISTRISQ